MTWLRLTTLLAIAACALAGCANKPSALTCSTGIVCPSPLKCAAVQAVCIENDCGDGHVDVGEQCDDGNIMDGDGCSHSCQNEVCGNGVIDPGEQCDDGNTVAGDGCSPTCQIERCGNGVIDPGEACDLGSDNGKCLGCNADCTSNETCGNCHVDTECGEVCDDCNTVSGDSCESDCKSGIGCGNGVLDPGEQCDDGNTDNNDDCTNQCKVNICGDGIVDSDGHDVEQCDPGGSAAPNTPQQCNDNCTVASCGDGIVNPNYTPPGASGPEQCDDGSDNSDSHNCTAHCQIAYCGDGLRDLEAPHIEQCDDGNQVEDDGCSNSCTTPLCGNGIVDSGEQCDLGAANSDTGACTTACTIAKCGDHLVETGVEQCDGSSVMGHACSASCTIEVCGNKIIDPGEQCDDGNTAANDGCGPTCQIEYCGDGIKNNVTEQCDPAGTTSPNTPAQCNSDCTLASCGDGKVDHSFVPAGAPGGEQCDPPSMLTGCSATCQLETCGDGHTDMNLGETCDNGSAMNTLAGPCLPWCQLATCGDGLVETHSMGVTGSEECDNGDANGTTACPYGATSCTVCTSMCKTAAGTTSYCGDHVKDTGNGENCDDATDGETECAYKGTNVASNTCQVCTDCQPQTALGPYCGDAVKTNGEACDNGFALNGTTLCPYGQHSCSVCTSTCTSTAGTTFEFCGDGTKNGPEQCDGGVGGVETDTSNCNKDCTTPSCGDGYVNTAYTPPGAASPEQCEPPNTATCDSKCQIIAYCGDGACNGSETPVTCPADCPGSCGDGIIEAGEECDKTNLNGATCASFGYTGSGLACNMTAPNACKYDTSGCTKPATCTDGIQNEDETDVDCGGTTCFARCADGKHCVGNSDCASATCTATVCQPSCTDGFQDGAETDVDCGGALCDGSGHKCPSGDMCSVNTDCTSGTCKANGTCM
ncbi:MAG TPA: DUF4215 domain-containing protein [Kofleriaceae bacterium]|nr:DUF4215 domain-containing protein [Kofleriaceae bacterium]